MTELLLLKLLSIHKYYEKYVRFISKHVLSEENSNLIEDFGKYYTKYNTDIDFDKFITFFSIELHANYSKDKLELYQRIIENIAQAELTKDTEDDLIKTFIKREAFGRIADEALKVAEGESDADSDDLKEILQHYEEEVGKVSILDSKRVTMDLEVIMKDLYSGEALEWRLEELNMSIGTPRGLIVVPARKDSGKTTFLASEVSYFATQTQKDVVWFSNEEAGNSVAARFNQALLGVEEEDILADPLKYKAIRDGMIDVSKIILKEQIFHVQEIIDTLKECNPGVIVIDQLWNCDGFEKRAANEVSRQGMLFGAARRWAQQYSCPVIVAHQLGGEAEGEKYPTMDMLYGSKTAIQAHADAIITIGRISEPQYENVRWLGVLASKLGKGPKVDKTLRHGQFEVEIHPEIARYKGI